MARSNSAKNTHHLKHRLAGGCRRVEALLVQEQVNAERVQLGQKPNQILQTAAQPINAPSHHHVEFAARSRFAERTEGRPAIAALRAANAVVLINFGDLAAHVAGNLPQLTFWVGRGLIGGRDPQIENSAFHRKALVFDAGTIAHYVTIETACSSLSGFAGDFWYSQRCRNSSATWLASH